MKQLWTVLHTHRFGASVYLFRSETEPTTEQIVESGVDFEDDMEEESLEVWITRDGDITEL